MGQIEYNSKMTDVNLTISCCYCSVLKSCLTLCDPLGSSRPGFPALHYLLEFAETHIH